MTSDLQIASNQHNALKSTGPQTPEGKAAVSLNALKHGLRSSRVVIPGESQEEYDRLCAELNIEWQPEGPTELHYVQRLAVSTWKLDRMERKESELAAQGYTDGLNIIWQHQARLERSYDNARATLERLKKSKAESEKPKPTQQPKPVQSAVQQQQQQQPYPKPQVDMRRSLANNVPGTRPMPKLPQSR